MLLLLSYSIITLVNPFSAFAFTRPNIVLIVIDTLRADHVSAYGYPRKTTPFIDSLAEKGTVFTHAYSPSSWTVPSVASLFTGYYPFRHGVFHRTSRKNDFVAYERLPSQFVTLAEQFKKSGYLTIGVTANGLMDKKYGFDQGFDYFVCEHRVPADRTHELFNRVLGKLNVPSKRPFFLWIHYFDPHEVYHLRKPWIQHYFPLSKFLTFGYLDGALRETVGNRELAIAAYDSEINYVDRYIKLLFQNLPRQDTITVITSDHGEEFLEHGNWGHSKNLHGESIAIPLIINRLDRPIPGRRIKQAASLVDLYPTLLSWAGIMIPHGLDGQILSMHPPTLPPEPRTIYSELALLDLGKSTGRKLDTHLVLIKDNFKFYKRLNGGKSALYQIDRDPGETVDLSRKKPEIRSELGKRMRDWETKRQQGAIHPARQIPKEPDPQLIKDLKALGYLQ